MKPGIKFRKHILVPLSVTLLILLSASIVNTYRLKRLNIFRDDKAHIHEVQQVTSAYLSESSQVLSEAIYLLKRNKKLQQAWFGRDKDALMSYAESLLKKYFLEKKITHFYFIDLNRVCFLRLHKPESCGDIIDRFTLMQSIRKVAPASGIELGPFGTLTLREVHPWWIEGELAGYIEAGVEIEFITPKLQRLLDSELIFTVNKSYLDRTRWEEGLKMIGRRGDWNRFPKFVVVYRTFEHLSSKLSSHIQFHVGQDEEHITNISSENRKYRIGFLPLKDAGSRKLGHIVVLKDITKKETVLHIQLMTMITTSGIIGVLMLGFFYFYVGRIERRLVDSHSTLKNEIAERKQAEKALRESQDKLGLRVRERTNELKMANEQLQLQLIEGKQAEAEIRHLSQKLINSIEAERSKIARDLHDEFGQALTTLRFGIETLINNLPDELKEQKTKCDALIHIIEKQCDNIRNIVSELRPDMLEHMGLVPTMEWYIQDFVKQKEEFRVDFQAIGIKTRPDAETELILYRILQESLTNIVKHAMAKNVNITLTYSHPNLIFVIKDDGIGFEPSELVSQANKKYPGVGLIGMRERITAVKGVIDIRSTNGKGTVIRVELPATLIKSEV